MSRVHLRGPVQGGILPYMLDEMAGVELNVGWKRVQFIASDEAKMNTDEVHTSVSNKFDIELEKNAQCISWAALKQ